MYKELIQICKGNVQSLKSQIGMCEAQITFGTKMIKNKYKKIVGTKKFVHNRIIQLLKVQLQTERNRLAYMQNLETWLNNHTWEKYANMKKSHGEDDNRITRKL